MTNVVFLAPTLALAEVLAAGLGLTSGVPYQSSRMRLIRVFPRRTRATPTDVLAYFGPPDLMAEADEVHVDCTFTWDRPVAVAPVRLGGVAYGDPGAEFVPGRYIKHGYGFTSRGCPRRCWLQRVEKGPCAAAAAGRRRWP
jgi:hypothetical protein